MSADPVIRGVDQCPNPETLAAFLDNRLSESDREAIAAHLTSCETCYAVFLETIQTKPAAAVLTDAPQRFTTRKVIIATTAGLAAAAALVLAVLVPWRSQPGVEESSMQALVVAMGSERTIEPRLSGGFAYGPVRGPVRAGEPAADTLPPDVRIAAALIEKQALADRATRTLQALGVSYLVRGDASRAVPVLEEAADHPAHDATVLSDLAAAYLVRATREETPQDLVKALTLAERAVKADPGLNEAWFNRALILERLSLTERARQGWEDYLKIDSTSGWAGEARAHLAGLNGRPQSRRLEEDLQQLTAAVTTGGAEAMRSAVQSRPEATREWLQNELLQAWPGEVLEGRFASAAARLEQARNVAAAVEEFTGDRFMADAVVAMRVVSTHPENRAAVARAHRIFHASIASYQSDRIRDAMAGFREARPFLVSAKSPFALWGQLFLAIGSYYEAALPKAAEAAATVARMSDTKSYFRLAGLARRVTGLVLSVQGDFANSLDQYRLAAVAFDRAKDTESTAALRPAIAEELGFLGEPDLSWSEVLASLETLPTVRDHRTRHNILTQAALASLGAGLPEGALHFQNAVLENARAWDRPLAIFDAHLYQSEILKQLNQLPQARSELAAAQQVLSQVSDVQLVQRNEPRLQLALGEVALPDRSAAAVTILSSALASFERTERNWPIARVLLARGRAHLAEGNVPRAEADFQSGIELFERRRASIANEALRTASFEQPWDLYSEMIRLQIDTRHQPDQALVFAERARARTLLESLAGGESVVPVDPTVARRELPPSVTVLYYTSLGNRLLIWLLSREQSVFVDTPTDSNDVGHLLNQFQSELAARPTAGRDTVSLSKLYDVLIRPVRDRIPEGAHIVVVPDGVLHSVPFAALVRAEDRRYMVEDHAIQYAPSLTILLQATARHPAARRLRSALVVGNPTPGGEESGVAPDLPEAGAEAADVAAFYTNPRVLVGDAATKAAVLEAPGRYDVIHFAGHAVANDRFPHLSRLLLAGHDASSRSLFAQEIAAQQLTGTQLVVLGACRTSGGRIRRGEGVLSLARPFLTAGTPAVLAALWDVDDRASRQLLVAFHRQLPRSRTPADALRLAQLEMMGETNPILQGPSAWAGFTLIGGVTHLGDSTEERLHSTEGTRQ